MKKWIFNSIKIWNRKYKENVDRLLVLKLLVIFWESCVVLGSKVKMFIVMVMLLNLSFVLCCFYVFCF